MKHLQITIRLFDGAAVSTSDRPLFALVDFGDAAFMVDRESAKATQVLADALSRAAGRFREPEPAAAGVGPRLVESL